MLVIATPLVSCRFQMQQTLYTLMFTHCSQNYFTFTSAHRFRMIAAAPRKMYVGYWHARCPIDPLKGKRDRNVDMLQLGTSGKLVQTVWPMHLYQLLED